MPLPKVFVFVSTLGGGLGLDDSSGSDNGDGAVAGPLMARMVLSLGSKVSRQSKAQANLRES